MLCGLDTNVEVKRGAKAEAVESEVRRVEERIFENFIMLNQ